MEAPLGASIVGAASTISSKFVSSTKVHQEPSSPTSSTFGKLYSDRMNMSSRLGAVVQTAAKQAAASSASNPTFSVTF